MPDGAERVDTDALPTFSIVIPVRNEADNVAPLAREIHDVLAQRAAFEIIFVDDASTDETAANIRAIRREHAPRLLLLRH